MRQYGLSSKYSSSYKSSSCLSKRSCCSGVKDTFNYDFVSCLYFSYYSDRVEERIINRELIGQRELLQLSMETANNRIEISKINSDMISIEKQISDVVEGLKDVVTKSELADMMNSFISDDDEKWLMSLQHYR